MKVPFKFVVFYMEGGSSGVHNLNPRNNKQWYATN